MVSVCLLSLEREVGGVLVRGVVPQRELHGATVNTGALAVVTSEAINPGDTAQELTLDGTGALRVGMVFVQEDWVSGSTPVGHLRSEARST